MFDEHFWSFSSASVPWLDTCPLSTPVAHVKNLVSFLNFFVSTCNPPTGFACPTFKTYLQYDYFFPLLPAAFLFSFTPSVLSHLVSLPLPLAFLNSFSTPQLALCFKLEHICCCSVAKSYLTLWDPTMWRPKDERADKTKESLGMKEWKNQTLIVLPSPMLQLLTDSGPPEQYNLSPLLPHRAKVFALLFPHPVYVPHPISKWLIRPLSCSLYPGYKNALRTPVQRWFSLELAHCFNRISHSNKFYFPSFCLMSGNSFPTHAWTTTHTL